MPTSHKREAVQLRPEVHDLLLQLVKETSLSKSKMLSILVEEALTARGMWKADTPSEPLTKKVGGVTMQVITQKPKTNTPKQTFTSFMEEQMLNKPVEEPEPTPEIDADDEMSEMLRKIKVLKAAGVL